MSESEKVYIDDRAWIGWQKLPEHVKIDIIRTLESLERSSPQVWPSRIRVWEQEENVFVLPVWVDANELFVFFYVENDRIHIDSLIYRSLIEQLRGKRVTELA